MYGEYYIKWRGAGSLINKWVCGSINSALIVSITIINYILNHKKKQKRNKKMFVILNEKINLKCIILIYRILGFF